MHCHDSTQYFPCHLGTACRLCDHELELVMRELGEQMAAGNTDSVWWFVLLEVVCYLPPLYPPDICTAAGDLNDCG